MQPEGLLTRAQASKLERDLADSVGESKEAPRVQAMAKVARTRDPELLGFVEKLLTVAEAAPVRMHALVAGLTEAMNLVARSGSLDDPLAKLDDALPEGEASAAVALAEAQATETRRALLRDSLSAEEAGRLTRRSRQALERLRRLGRVLALREGNQWRYPRWQLDPDAPGGILPGLGEVLGELRLSPVGAAFWLTRREERLRGTPIQLLRARRVEPVLAAAREQSERP